MNYAEIVKELRAYTPGQTYVNAGKLSKLMKDLNREQKDTLLSNFEKDSHGLEVQIQNSEFVIGLKKRVVKSYGDELLYQLGKFEGMTRIIASARRRQAENARVQGGIKRILSKNKTGDILQYIYEHPNAQHGEIAKAVAIRPNTLTYRMKELTEVGGVETYAEGKYRYYDLTLLGREYIESTAPAVIKLKSADSNKKLALDQFYRKRVPKAFKTVSLDRKKNLKEVPVRIFERDEVLAKD